MREQLALMKTLALLLPILLGGCALVQQAPTLKYCDTVKYERTGREINITLHCFEAVESMLPIPLPKP